MRYSEYAQTRDAMATKMKVGKKGSRSKTQKGRKNFTTKKTSKYHVVGGHRVKSMGKPFSKRRSRRSRK